MNTESQLTIATLQNTLFVIPDYQRGYRWTDKEVEKLLKDLISFPGDKYCLQPLELMEMSKDEVLKTMTQGEDEACQKILKDKLETNKFKAIYRLVDGQQRLTTVSLIAKELGIPISWDIYYKAEKKFLLDLDNEQPSDSINAYFRTSIAHKIREKIADSDKRKIVLDYFKETGKQLVFLKHKLEKSSEDPEGHKAFTRLNSGKTPLTSSELIRALYMTNESCIDGKERAEIAKEWELIENTLAEQTIWCMFNAKELNETPTRIDLLFALVLGVDLKSPKTNPRVVFEELETRVLDKTADLMVVWHEIMRCFWWIQSCYNDTEIFNYLGWIAKSTNKDALYIYKQFLTYPSAEDFKERVIGIIQQEDLPDVNDVVYGNSNLPKLFLLLNILTCNNSKERFRFDLMESYDIEHIDSQTPNDLTSYESRAEWLYSVWNEGNANTRKRIESVVGKVAGLSDLKEYCKAQPFPEGFVEEIYPRNEYQNFDSNRLGNLALLNSSINRSYHNDIFPQKRKRIREELQLGGRYIPPCTAKIFTKFYTENASHITEWRNDDFDGYMKAMNELLTKFQKLASNGAEKDETSRPLLVACNTSTANTNNDCKIQPPISDNRLNGKVSFAQFMGRYYVIIPEIQRLYVQGRKDAYGLKCLKAFATALVKSVVTGAQQPLDLVYGIEVNNGDVFLPLDGQQRLTTLLLLSWLLKKTSIKYSFRYVSRRATEIFVEKLLQTSPLSLSPSLEDIRNRKKEARKDKDERYLPVRDYIRSRDWFLSIWEKDPCIDGMLEMLDSLYDKLIFAKEYYAKENMVLRSKDQWDTDGIFFDIHYLDMSDTFYDQIFLKMNSRGKELSPWENVKAILDIYVPDGKKGEWKNKIDFDWPEELWKKWRDEEDANVRIKNLDKRLLELVSYSLRVAGYTKAKEDVFEIDKWLSEKSENSLKFFDCAQILFSAVEFDRNDLRSCNFMTPVWASEPMIPDLSKETAEFLKPLTVYYAFQKGNCNDENWKRIVWNLVENSVSTVESMIATMQLIDTLAAEAKPDILTYLANYSQNPQDNNKCFKQQLLEECEKAKLIKGINGDVWRSRIENAEKLSYLRGHLAVIIKACNNSGQDFDDIIQVVKCNFPEKDNNLPQVEIEKVWTEAFKSYLPFAMDCDLPLSYNQNFFDNDSLKTLFFLSPEKAGVVKWLEARCPKSIEPNTLTADWAKNLFENWDDIIRNGLNEYMKIAKYSNSKIYLYRTRNITRAQLLTSTLRQELLTKLKNAKLIDPKTSLWYFSDYNYEGDILGSQILIGHTADDSIYLKETQYYNIVTNELPKGEWNNPLKKEEIDDFITTLKKWIEDRREKDSKVKDSTILK